MRGTLIIERFIMTTQQDILDFWFKETPKEKWFVKDLEFDEVINCRFSEIYEMAASGELDEWLDTPEGCLALVIILDQFSRNKFRSGSKSYATDELALSISKTAIERNFDSQLTNDEHRAFLYMPFMHSEDLSEQEKGVELFNQFDDKNGADYAVAHKVIIEKFGRFPHRNEILGRASTPEEIEFLKQPGSSF